MAVNLHCTKTQNKTSELSDPQHEWGASLLTTDTQLLKDIKEGYDLDPYFLNIYCKPLKTNPRPDNKTQHPQRHEIPPVEIYMG